MEKQRSLRNTIIICLVLLAGSFFAGRCTAVKEDCSPLDEALLLSLEDSVDVLSFELDSVRKRFAVALIDNAQLKSSLEDARNSKIEYKYITRVKTDKKVLRSMELLKDTLEKERDQFEITAQQARYKAFLDSLNKMDLLQQAVSLRTELDSVLDANQKVRVAQLIDDPWINATFTFNPPIAGLTSEPVLDLEASLYDEIDLIQKTQKHGFLNLGRKTHFVDVYNANPYVTKLNVKSFQIEEKARRFGFGPYIGGGYNNQGHFSWQAGFGLNYSLIRF